MPSLITYVGLLVLLSASCSAARATTKAKEYKDLASALQVRLGQAPLDVRTD